jgi:hypothetical protein
VRRCDEGSGNAIEILFYVFADVLIAAALAVITVQELGARGAASWC